MKIKELLLQEIDNAANELLETLLNFLGSCSDSCGVSLSRSHPQSSDV
ncbi:MAG: hypothetical protein QNJ47_10845 [Nostocaceae cyanobacterium]|nr:hypothetical protein [Nostocaceae cyanobacterium]